jgi:hypothetical protein
MTLIPFGHLTRDDRVELANDQTRKLPSTEVLKTVEAVTSQRHKGGEDLLL